MYVTFEDIRTFDVVGRAAAGEADTVGEELSLGSLHDVYVDTRDWRVMWLVLEAGHWLASDRVLIGTDHRVGFDTAGRRLVTDLTRYDVETAAAASSVRTVSEQRSEEGAPRDGGGLSSGRSGRIASGLGVGDAALVPDAGVFPPSEEERHLGSARELIGYMAVGRDAEEVGPVTDLLIDTDSPAIAWLSIGTGGWLEGRDVVIRPEWAVDVSWSARRVTIELSREQVRGAPPLETLDGLDRAYASALARFYRFPTL